MHVTAIIAAGGTGRRLGAAVPKQLLEIGGRTILERSVAAFASHPQVTDVIVALPADVVAAPPAWLEQYDRVRVVAGGARRQDSVAAAFLLRRRSDGNGRVRIVIADAGGRAGRPRNGLPGHPLQDAG